jgi:hypothetical protein
MFQPLDGIVVPITPTLDLAAYATGDLLFQANKLEKSVLNGKGFAYVREIVVLDSANQKAALDLIFFNEDPGSLGTLNSAIDLSAAQLAKMIGLVSIASADYVTLKANTNAIATKIVADLLLPAVATSKDLWVAGISRGSPDYAAATDLTFKFMMERH